MCDEDTRTQENDSLRRSVVVDEDPRVLPILAAAVAIAEVVVCGILKGLVPDAGCSTADRVVAVAPKAKVFSWSQAVPADPAQQLCTFDDIDGDVVDDYGNHDWSSSSRQLEDAEHTHLSWAVEEAVVRLLSYL